MDAKYQENKIFREGRKMVKSIERVTFSDLKKNALDYGLKNDGISDNYEALKFLINDLKKTGGQILFPAGTYFMDGPIVLYSDIQLVLKKGANIVFGWGEDKYLVNSLRKDRLTLTTFEGTSVYNYCPFIYGYQVENVAITGKGTITVQSEKLFSWRKIQKPDQKLTRKMNNENVPIEERAFGTNHFLRMELISFLESKRILISGIKIEEAPFWLIHMTLSSHIVIDGVRYQSHRLNNDGIDPEGSHHILIQNCQFDNGDDCIAVKSFRDLEGMTRNIPTSDVFIRKCSFKGLNAVSIGSEVSGGAQRIYVENCKSHGDVDRALHIKVNRDRGGIVEKIYFRKMSFHNVKTGISIISNYKNENTYNRIPIIRDIYINRIKFKNVTERFAEIEGLEESKIERVIITQIETNLETKKLSHVKDIQIGDEKICLI